MYVERMENVCTWHMWACGWLCRGCVYVREWLFLRVSLCMVNKSVRVCMSDLMTYSLHVRWVRGSPQESLAGAAFVPASHGQWHCVTAWASSASQGLCRPLVPPPHPDTTWLSLNYLALTVFPLHCGPWALTSELASVSVSCSACPCALTGSLRLYQLLWREVGMFIGLDRHCLRCPPPGHSEMPVSLLCSLPLA